MSSKRHRSFSLSSGKPQRFVATHSLLSTRIPFLWKEDTHNTVKLLLNLPCWILHLRAIFSGISSHSLTQRKLSTVAYVLSLHSTYTLFITWSFIAFFLIAIFALLTAYFRWKWLFFPLYPQGLIQCPAQYSFNKQFLNN